MRKLMIATVVFILFVIIVVLLCLPASAEVDRFTITFDANGGQFADESTVRAIECVSDYVYVEKVSHTENLSDTGEHLGDYGSSWGNEHVVGTDRLSGNSYAHVVSIPEVDSVHVCCYYWTGSSYDYVCFWSGSYLNYTAKNNYSSSVSGQLKQSGWGGGTPVVINGNVYDSYVKVYEQDLDTNEVTFSFTSRYSGTFGYYAVITGEKGNFGFIQNIYENPTYDMDYVQFREWNTEPDGSGVSYTEDTLKRVRGDITLYAQYDFPYELVYLVDGGFFPSTGSNRNVVTKLLDVIVDGTYEMPVPDDSTKGFSHWSTMPDGSGDVYDVTTSQAVTDSIVFYAVWDDTYTVVFDANGGVFESTGLTTNVVHKVGDHLVSGEYEYSVSNVPYAGFKSWNTAPDGSGTSYTRDFYYSAFYYIDSRVLSDTVLYAQYSDPISVVFDANGGTFADGSVTNTMYMNVSTGISGGSYLKPVSADSYGLFRYWTTNPDGTGSSFADYYFTFEWYNASWYVSALSSVGTLYAQYYPYYTITWYSNDGGVFEDGSTVNTTIVSNGTVVDGVYKVPVANEQYGCYVNWTANANGTGSRYWPSSEYLSINPSSNMSLYAQYVSPYTITWDGNGGTFSNGGSTNVTIRNSQQGFVSGSYEEPVYETPYAVFKYWTENQDGSGNNYTTYVLENYYSYPIGSTATVYAQWYLPYTITWNALGGSFSDGSSINETVFESQNRTIVDGMYEMPMPPDSNNSYYDLACIGWTSNSDGAFLYGSDVINLSVYGDSVPGTYNINSDVTLYAVYAVKNRQQYGVLDTVEWSITSDGVLVIRPKDGVSGTLPSVDDGNWSWLAYDYYRTNIRVVTIDPGVSSGENMVGAFASLPNLEVADLTGLDTTSAVDLHGMFDNDTKLNKIVFGENFDPKGDNIEDPSKWVSVPNVSYDSPYLGLWVRDDTNLYQLTSKSLIDDYDSSRIGSWSWGTTDVYGDMGNYVFDGSENAVGQITPEGVTVVFRNVFVIPPVSVSFKAYKSADFDYMDGSFTFELLDSNGNLIQRSTNGMVSQDEMGNWVSMAVFDELSYESEGQYKYYIREVAGSDSAVNYDDTVVCVTVDVRTNDNGDRFVASVSYGKYE